MLAFILTRCFITIFYSDSASSCLLLIRQFATSALGIALNATHLLQGDAWSASLKLEIADAFRSDARRISLSPTRSTPSDLLRSGSGLRKLMPK